MFVRVADNDAYEILVVLNGSHVLVQVHGEAVVAAAGAASRAAVVAGINLIAGALNEALVDAGIGAAVVEA